MVICSVEIIKAVGSSVMEQPFANFLLEDDIRRAELVLGHWELKKRVIDKEMIIRKLKRDLNVLTMNFQKLQDTSHALSTDNLAKERELEAVKQELVQWRDKSNHSEVAKNFATTAFFRNQTERKKLAAENASMKTELRRVKAELEKMTHMKENCFLIVEEGYQDKVRELEKATAEVVKMSNRFEKTEEEVRSGKRTIAGLEARIVKMDAQMEELRQEKLAALQRCENFDSCLRDLAALRLKHATVIQQRNGVRNNLLRYRDERDQLFAIMLQEGIEFTSSGPTEDEDFFLDFAQDS